VRPKGPPAKGILELKQERRQIVPEEDRDDEWLPSSNTASKYICKVFLVMLMVMVRVRIWMPLVQVTFSY